MIKRYFLTGLALILPLVLTLFIVNILVGWVTRPFANGVEQLLLLMLPAGSPLTKSALAIRLLSQISILISLGLFLVMLGFLTKTLLMRTLLKAGDAIFLAIPLANKVYNAVQEVLKNLFHQEKPSFSKVALVPFPHAQTHSVAFITRDTPLFIEGKDPHGYTPVFLPGTPNPMMGFILLVPVEKVKPLSMSFEEAVKFVASCGVIYKAPSD